MNLTLNQLIDSIQWILGYEKNRQNVNMKSYINFINQTIGTAFSYCPSCASMMKQIHLSFQTNIYRQVRDTAELQKYPLPVPNFKSAKFSSDYFKKELSVLPIEYIINNINDADNRAVTIQRTSKLSAELEQRLLIIDDIKLLQEYRDARYTYDEYLKLKIQELSDKSIKESANESIEKDDSEESIDAVRVKQVAAVKKSRTTKK
jgi:hypothetical protein